MKTLSPTNFPCSKDNIFLTVLKTNLLPENIVSWTQTGFICPNSAIITLEKYVKNVQSNNRSTRHHSGVFVNFQYI